MITNMKITHITYLLFSLYGDPKTFALVDRDP